MTAPPKPTDQEHKIRLMYGAGLRPQIWEQFVKRFKISNISEIYGSTEGNSNICKIFFFLSGKLTIHIIYFRYIESILKISITK